MKIGFIGLGVMGLPMTKNLMRKSGCEVYASDVSEERCNLLKEAGGHIVSAEYIYENCEIIMQVLPTDAIAKASIEKAIALSAEGTIIVDMGSTAPEILIELAEKAESSGKHLLDSPISGGNPMAISGTLAIMVGGNEDAFNKAYSVLSCMGSPVYTGESGSGAVTKLVNNMIAGATLVAMAEGYAFAAKAGIDLQKTFEATRCGFAGGPMYDNKVPKIIARDYEPGARVAVHRKDIIHAKNYAHKLGIDIPMTDVILHVMDWMKDNGHIDEDQAAMVKYYEEKMNVKVGE